MADKRRRKSLSIFRLKHDHAALPLTPESPTSKKSSDMPAADFEHDPPSPRQRPRTLQKPHRTSTFGSLRSLQSLEAEEKAVLTRSDSKASSLHNVSDVHSKPGLFGSTVLFYGEVQTGAGSVFRKKVQFMVLTESHLIRFRSQNKAAEMFPAVPSTISRSVSRISAGSYAELPMATYQDITSGIPLHHVVAVYQLEDGRPVFTVEVAHLDERSRRSSAIQMHFNDPSEAVAWMGSVRFAAAKARKSHAQSFENETYDYVRKVLERSRDYDPDHFQLFKVVQKSAAKSASRNSSDDLTKLNSTIFYLAIGLHKLHFIPITKNSRRSSMTALNELDTHFSHGVVSLTSIKVSADEDAFQLIFKTPLAQPYKAQLASSDACEIVLRLRHASEYLRPEWIRQPYVLEAPDDLDDRMPPPFPCDDDYGCFDRTLMAYASAYDVDASRLYYTIDHGCEDAPRFQLLPPMDEKPYTASELLAILKALRYNESFCTISFSGTNLCSLRYLYDIHATDIDSLTTRSGLPTNLLGHHDLPVLSQEIRSLALKSRRLRRLDFSSCFPLLSQVEDHRDSCCIPEALMPLCKRSLTNVDWIVLNGVLLADSDLNYFVDASSERRCHLRALELGDCGLSVHDIDVLLSTAAAQENTMEVINISGVQGRFSAELFQRQIGVFSHIRRLNLTRVQKTAGLEALIPPEVLMTWRLEALYLSQTNLNEQTIDSISAYLSCAKSEILRELHLNQCGLTGRDLAVFFRSMSRDDGLPREMHVSASENRLRAGISSVFKALGQNHGPTSLTMRMLDFEKELHFRELIEALTTNTTLRTLDISRASLPYDASTETCEALKVMFATNFTLQDLDMSGEHSHLDATRFGIGLNLALRGLEHNNSLRCLRIQHQSLGLQGATTLAVVIEKNSTLQEIYCDHNDLNLQSFTVLVNALENNTTLLNLPTMESDHEKSMDKVRKEIEAMERSESPKSPRGHSLKKSFSGALAKSRIGHTRVTSTSSTGSIDHQDIAMALSALDEKWNAQVARLQTFCYRNYCLANGYEWNHGDGSNGTHEASEKRPDTTGTMQRVFDKVLSFQTAEKEKEKASARYHALSTNERRSSEKKRSVFQFPDD